MNYEQLKKFILEEMRPNQGKNYQPIMIKTLIQNDGYATKEQIQLELQKANPEHELNFFADCPVFDVLTKSHPVAEYDKAKKIFHLLDYETFDDAQKASITNFCEQKISGNALKKYSVLENEKEIKTAQNDMIETLKRFTTKRDKAIIGFPGPGKNVYDYIEYVSSNDFWWHTKKLEDEETPRYWNCFGIGEPKWGKSNSITLEINPPIHGISRKAQGAFVKDQNGTVFLTHSGVLGGGNTPRGFSDYYPHQERWISAEDGKKDQRELILIGEVTSQKLPELIGDYLQYVAKYKSKIITENAPYYLLFRYTAEENPYDDDPSKGMYHFPKGNPNTSKVVPGSKAIWFDKIEKSYYFWGYGTISSINPRTERDIYAIFDDFNFFEEEQNSMKLNGYFLKKATPEIEDKIIHSPRFNNQHSIHEINKSIFEEIVGNKNLENIDTFEIAHKLFLLEMSQKDHKKKFIDFNHIDFVNEVNYKKKALEKSLTELSLEKWKDWLSTPEKICEAVRNAVAKKISNNLIWVPPHTTEIGYFDKLDKKSKESLGKSLFNFFLDSESIEQRFDTLIKDLKNVQGKPEIRLLSYLLFLYDSKKYFPILPTDFDNLLEFYGIEKIKEISWKKYSQYLDLASKLKLFLEKKFPSELLSPIQIQSYMWVLAGAVSKTYWIIRAGIDGSDWDNQRNAGVIGIHYYTIDLSKYAQPNNLSKRKLQEKMQELRKLDGKEPDSQGGLDADFGQLELIFSVRKKDKIIAIGNNSTLLGIGNATNKYQFRSDIGRNCHTIPVEWYDTQSRQILSQAISSIKKIDVKDYVDIMSTQATIQKQEYQKFFNILKNKKQFFFYGPPGTGKTFTAKKIAEAFTEQNNITNMENQRHTWRSVTVLVLLENDGLPLNYHEIAKRALEKNLVKTSGETPEETIAKIMRDDIQQLGTDSYFIKPSEGEYGLNIPTTFEKAAKIILYAENKPLHYTEIAKKAIESKIVISDGLTPEKSLLAEITSNIQKNGEKSTFIQTNNGTYALRKKKPVSTDVDYDDRFIENVTFHQSYGYEEFVEGIKPSPTENGIVYPIEPGIFKKFCEKAAANPKQNYVIIIDEINRGNISKIFGELITLIENDKRDDTFVTLAYSKKPFSVPSNVYIIGTMNTADRSLVHIDAGLKRRFAQYELMPDYTKIDAKIDNVHLGKLLETLNKIIIEANFRDNQIGHAYFMKETNPITKVEELQFAFAYDIIPLLKEYFYDDDTMLHKILGDKLIDENRNIIPAWTENESQFMKILEETYSKAFD